MASNRSFKSRTNMTNQIADKYMLPFISWIMCIYYQTRKYCSEPNSKICLLYMLYDLWINHKMNTCTCTIVCFFRIWPLWQWMIFFLPFYNSYNFSWFLVNKLNGNFTKNVIDSYNVSRLVSVTCILHVA